MYNMRWFPDNDITAFPDTSQALDYPDGLLAMGGNLSQHTLVSAYQQGIFPWFEDDQPIMWWSPSERAVIETNHIHISKNMNKLIKRAHYHVFADKDFEQTVASCAATHPDRQSTWITHQMKNAYLDLFHQGIAHSIEVYDEHNNLAGGLYGVFINNCFCGESMFSKAPNTSKLALIKLAQFLAQHGCEWIDCQLPTEHLSSMGAQVMPRQKFIQLIENLSDNIGLMEQSWLHKWQP